MALLQIESHSYATKQVVSVISNGQCCAVLLFDIILCTANRTFKQTACSVNQSLQLTIKFYFR